VNDGLGHHVGDDVLRLVAQRLAATIRPTDFVARLHGDEFAVIISDIDAPLSAGEVDLVVGRIVAALDLSITTVSPALSVSASIGYVRDGAAYDDPEAILRDADAAMYRSKRDGRNRATAHVAGAADAHRATRA
jgi:diguanylate cyclase (GGDEF)-like protein